MRFNQAFVIVIIGSWFALLLIFLYVTTTHWHSVCYHPIQSEPQPLPEFIFSNHKRNISEYDPATNDIQSIIDLIREAIKSLVGVSIVNRMRVMEYTCHIIAGRRCIIKVSADDQYFRFTIMDGLDQLYVEQVEMDID